ncbi:hypothetical protein [Variovorax sp. GB1P17]|uniref:hypothetical protein n=1 Tax=Variovorax sp. GB1P17 TaxID=3443740 RepID=UPI003F451245
MSFIDIRPGLAKDLAPGNRRHRFHIPPGCGTSTAVPRGICKALPRPGQPERDPLSDLLDLVRIRGEMALTCTPEAPFALSFPANTACM